MGIDIGRMISENFGIIVILILAYIAYRKGWLPILKPAAAGGGGGDFFGGIAAIMSNWGTVLIVLILAAGYLAVNQPDFYRFLSERGAPSQRIEEAKADRQVFEQDPRVIDYNQWPNPVARKGAKSDETEYDVAIARNEAAERQALTEKACYDPEEKGKLLDKGFDPCESSLPAGIQVARQTLEKVNLDSSAISRPTGAPPQGASQWIVDLYNLPQWASVLGLIIAALITLKLAWKVF